MSHRSSSEIREEIASIQDTLLGDFPFTEGELEEYHGRIEKGQANLKIVEQIEELENMEDYGRNSPVQRFEEMLDECCDEIHIGTLTYLPSHVLKNVDPIAYREAYWEWANNEIADLEDQIEE